MADLNSTVSRVHEVYKHTNKLNGKSYIGLTCNGVRQRLYAHESATRSGSDLPFHRAIRRYGIEAFETTVMASCFGLAAAREVEQLLIKELGTFGRRGYNATAGGEGTKGTRPTKARRRQISKQFREMVRTPQHKLRISEALSGKPKTPEAIKAQSAARRGVRQDLVRKAASLAALEMAKAVWEGSKHAPEAKQAMRDAKSKPIRILWPNGDSEVRITTLGALAEQYCISTAALSKSISVGRAIAKKCGLYGCALTRL